MSAPDLDALRALDERLRRGAGERGDELWVYGVGLVYLSVCTLLTDEVATERLNRDFPTGISSDWYVANEPFADGSANPSPCPDSEAHRHVLFSC